MRITMWGQRLTDAMLCIVCFYAIAQCGTKQKEHNYKRELSARL